MKKRLISVTGPTQLIFAVAAIKTRSTLDEAKNYIIIHNSAGNKSLKAETLNTIYKMLNVWNWANIVEINDIFFKMQKFVINKKNLYAVKELLKFKNLKKEVEDIKKELKERIGSDKFDEIYLCKWNSYQEWTLKSIYPEAKKIFYEGGIGTYINNKRYKLALKKIIKKILYKLFGIDDIFCASFKKKEFNEGYLLRPDLCPKDLRKIIYDLHKNKVEAIKSAISDIRNSLGLYNLYIDEHKPVILLVESALHRIGFSFDKEIEIYHKSLTNIKNRTSETKVLLKPHPRNDRYHIELLKKKLMISEIDNRLSHLPIEIIPSCQNIKTIISHISTSVFTLKEIYDIDSVLTVEDSSQFSAIKDFLNNNTIN